jgi:glyoxylase-like metal-dependent hydrolase (beta-lactamase superfamily II)
MRSALTDGIHRVSFTIDDKLHAFHAAETPRGIVLFDTGVPSTPEAEFAPFLGELGYDLEDVHTVVFTHADADHIGGNVALRDANPSVTYAAHVDDLPLIASVETIWTERYRAFEPYGVEYGTDVIEWLDEMLPPADEPVDVGLRGGEEIPLVDGRTLELHHAPGHTDGHLIAYEPESDVVVGGDVIYPEGAFDVNGDPLQPPPYVDADAYLQSIELLRGLSPATLSLTHFKPLHGDEVTDFLDRASDWVVGFESTLVSVLADADRPLTVPELIDRITERQGSFGLDLDLAFPITSHLDRLAERGRVEETTSDGLPAFSRA